MNVYFPSLSVAIPVKNGYPEIKSCIDGILKQTIPVKEIIVVDSGSTDKTLHYLRSVPKVRLIQIRPEEFNHGGTRNLLWQACSTEFIAYTVQDARPVDEYWLANLLKGFVDPQVVAVCGQQVVPHDLDKNPFDWFRPVSEPNLIRYQVDSEKSKNSTPKEKLSECGWDDVTALYKTAILKAIPFKETVFGEDMIWAKETLDKGHAIVYNYAARVYHYHLENYNFTFKRIFATMFQQYKYFGVIPERPSMPLKTKISILKTLFISIGPDISSIAKWYRYNTARFTAVQAAYRIFMSSLDEGKQALCKKHEQLCYKPPVPVKINE